MKKTHSYQETKIALDSTLFTYQAFLFCYQHILSLYKDSSEDKRINHTIGNSKFSFWLSDLTNIKNHNVAKAYLIIENITLLIAILEHYLGEVLKERYKVSEKELHRHFGRKLIDYFIKKTEINIRNFEEYNKINFFWDLRNDSLKNLGKVGRYLKKYGLTTGDKIILYPEEHTIDCYKTLNDFIEKIDTNVILSFTS